MVTSAGINYAYRIRAIDFQVSTTDYSDAVSIQAQQGRQLLTPVITMMLLAQ